MSFLAGLAAGTASSLSPQPADVLSRVNARGAVPRGPGFSVYTGGRIVRWLLPRGVGAAREGLVISGQFARSTTSQSLFAVAGPDLTLHLDLAL